ncbi:hypothetical protein CEXT_109011 [Caerostris extrusa]|uniref:Uncharacterized protein n=1 Tax=Caerostris extrusa TaxID=172846 RepID=A0AAV4VGV0_CAEEX|nr:hypothetical protein CEXT_109011 [Caerostris extrusa]
MFHFCVNHMGVKTLSTSRAQNREMFFVCIKLLRKPRFLTVPLQVSRQPRSNTTNTLEEDILHTVDQNPSSGVKIHSLNHTYKCPILYMTLRITPFSSTKSPLTAGVRSSATSRIFTVFTLP